MSSAENADDIGVYGLFSKGVYFPLENRLVFLRPFSERVNLFLSKKVRYAELKEWHSKSGLPLKKFFNTSGLIYKSMSLKDKLPTMSEDEQLKLLEADGMLVN